MSIDMNKKGVSNTTTRSSWPVSLYVDQFVVPFRISSKNQNLNLQHCTFYVLNIFFFENNVFREKVLLKASQTLRSLEIDSRNSPPTPHPTAVQKARNDDIRFQFPSANITSPKR